MTLSQHAQPWPWNQIINFHFYTCAFSHCDMLKCVQWKRPFNAGLIRVSVIRYMCCCCGRTRQFGIVPTLVGARSGIFGFIWKGVDQWTMLQRHLGSCKINSLCSMEKPDILFEARVRGRSHSVEVRKWQFRSAKGDLWLDREVPEVVLIVESSCPHNDHWSHSFRVVKTLNFCLPGGVTPGSPPLFKCVHVCVSNG